jgi:tetratricopeptide (TPR) repeat protein
VKSRLLLPLIAYLTLAPFFCPPPEVLAEGKTDPRMRLFFRQGIEKIFNMEENAGTAALLRGIEIDPDNPLGYAFLSMAGLFFLESSFAETERARRQEEMLKFAEEALVRGERRISADPRDGPAYFAAALAKITRIRWFIGQRRFFAMARETGNVWDFLEKAREEDPQNHDVLFATGLLLFHLDHLPGFTRFVSSLLITSGDRRRGLEELAAAAQKGDLLRDLARAELVSVYLNFEKQPEKALFYARELKEKYPRNYNFAFALGNVLADLRRADEAFALAAGIEEKIQAGVPPYRPEILTRQRLLMGRIYFEKGDYARAADYFQRVVRDPAPYHARTRAWAYVRLGMIADVRKERKNAEEYYRLALGVEGGEGLAQTAARIYLEAPYAPDAVP